MNQEEELPPGRLFDAPLDPEPAPARTIEHARARELYAMAVAFRLGTTGQALRPWCEQAWRIAHYALGVKTADIPVTPWEPEEAMDVPFTIDSQGRKQWLPRNTAEAKSLVQRPTDTSPNPIAAALQNTKDRLARG